MISRGHILILLFVIFLFHGFMAIPQPRKVIIDCDPGIDDALALILAIESPDFEILGITTVFGNCTIEQATNNALRIVEISGQDIPVYRGAEKPLNVPLDPPPSFVHGEDGLGNTQQPKPSLRSADKPAWQFIIDMVRSNPGEVTILAVGRLTNLAEAIKMQPDIVKDVKEVVLMGGALYVPGNVGPVTEANIGGDPHAADLVFTAPWKVTMIPLDVTTKVKFDDDFLAEIKKGNSKYGAFIFDISQFYMNFHKNVSRVEGGFYVHDPSAIMYLMQPSIFEMKKGPVRVVSEGIAIGQTIMAAYDHHLKLEPWSGKPFVSVATDVDVGKFLKTYLSIMMDTTPVK
jgi:purine nucleosidase